jgi:hypothetical protein
MLRSELKECGKQQEAAHAANTELEQRVCELEHLQAQAKETVLLSEAKLQAAQEYGGGSDFKNSNRNDDVGDGLGGNSGWDKAGAVQLWWIELAQRLKQEEKQQAGSSSSGSNHVHFAALPTSHHQYHHEDANNDDGNGTLGARLVEAKERESQLSQSVKDQGLEVVFLRQVTIS